jgi:hypothetical protein
VCLILAGPREQMSTGRQEKVCVECQNVVIVLTIVGGYGFGRL